MVAALAGCDDEPTAPRVLPLCGAPVSVTVSAGLAPTFDWSPACRVSMLQVSEADTEFPVWTVFAAPLDERGIAPAVTYGSLPVGAFRFNPEPLAPALEDGTTYVLVLTVVGLLIGEHEVGRQEFTP
jgi:hypothetical protein